MDRKQLAYLPGLDGLRALAVIAVLLYHAEQRWAPGGFLGVEIFFVISGFLITSLLLQEFQQHNMLDLGRFWLRRVRRLAPAAFVVIIAVLAYAVFLIPQEVAGLRRDALAGFSYTTNWYLIFDHQSYFQTVGRPSLFRHLWSLAVEGQFYLIWPVILMLVLSVWSRRRALGFTLAAAVASAVLMAVLYQPDFDPSRIYYGTDTRAAGLLFGSALAFVWIPGQLPQWTERMKSWMIDAVGCIALGALGFFILWMDEFGAVLYRGGFAAVAFTTILLIAVAVHPRSQLASQVLARQPLHWIGTRSYSIYLWHWPVFMLTRAQIDMPFDQFATLGLRMLLTFGLAELSYRYVETPARNGAIGRLWKRIRTSVLEAKSAPAWLPRLRVAGGLGGTFACCVALGFAVVSAEPMALPAYLNFPVTSDESIVAAAEIVENHATTASVTPTIEATPLPLPITGQAGIDGKEGRVSSGLASVSMPEGESKTFASDASAYPKVGGVITATATATVPAKAASSVDIPTATKQAAATIVKAVTPTVIATATQASTAMPTAIAVQSSLASSAVIAGTPGVTATATTIQGKAVVTATAQTTESPKAPEAAFAVGDSVMLGAAPALRQAIPGIEVDAAVSRQAGTMVEIVANRHGAGLIKGIVVVQMGNNGPISQNQFDALMANLAEAQQVLIVNLKEPRQWEAHNNAIFAEGVKRYSNATLIDWYAAGVNHPEYFYDDGIHLQPEGAQAFAAMVAAAIK